MESKEYPEDIDFQKYWLILKRHWLPATAVWGTTIVIAALVGFSRSPVHEAYGKLRFKRQDATSALVTEAGEKIGKLDALNSKDTPLDTEAEVIRSAPTVNQTIAALNLKDQKGKPVAYEDFLKNLKVGTIRGTDILSISYKSRKPEEALNVVDLLMKNYIKSNVLTNRTEVDAARKFMIEQLPKVENNVQHADILLRNFKEKNNIIDLEQEAKTLVVTLDNLDQQINLNQAEIAKTTGRITEIQKKIGMSSKVALAENSLNQSLAVQQVFEKLKEVEDQLAIERTRLQDENPTIVNLKSKQAALEVLLNERAKQVTGNQQQAYYKNIQKVTNNGKENIQESLTENLINSEAEHQALMNQLVSLLHTRSDYKQRVSSLPKLQQTQRELERKLDAAQDSYKLLLKNYEELRIAENKNVGNAQIVSPATMLKSSVSSSKRLILGAGFLVGALLYIVTAFILEINNSSIKSTREVRTIFKYTLLGMIPCLRRKVTLTGIKTEHTPVEHQVKDLPHSIISETYKMLQANLKFLSPDQDLKVVVVTSSVSREGKSTVSTNLAVALAQLESRVLLIDADLHHPQQHHIWELTNEVGLSEVIVGQAELKKAVKQVMLNLDVLPSGVIPPNSLALLSSKRMKSLIEEFSKIYDFVIIDTPPLLLLADALTLGKMSDGILLVARPGEIDTVSANATKELLEQSGQNVLGLVINGVMVENEPDSYFHYAKAYSDRRDTKQPLSFIFKS